MGTKFGQFEESTKITSSSEIDEILKQARSAPEPEYDDDDGIDDFSERTKVGNVQELAAQFGLVDDPPPPVVARTMSQNVIRRSEPMAVPRTSESMPSVRAQGSLSDITPPPAEPAGGDDAAFDPWDEQPVRSISQPLPIVSPPPEIEEPPVYVEAEAPVHVQPEPQPQPAKPHGVRWGVIAWFMLLAAMLGAGTVGYLRIAQLETELAQTKIELQRANAR